MRHTLEATSFDLGYRLAVPIWVFDIDKSRVLHANEAACRLWQAVDEEELKARDLGNDMSQTVSKRLKQYQSDFMQSNACFTELWTLYPNGRPTSVMVTYKSYPLPCGRMAMLCEAASSADLQPQNMRSAEALLHTDVMIMLFSKGGPDLYLNPAARNAFSGKIASFSTLFSDTRDYEDVIAETNKTGEQRRVARMKTSQGVRWFDVTTKNCLDAATGAPAILITAIDVTELKEARDTARHLADRDQLTGLHNRSFLQAHLSSLQEQWDVSTCAIIFFDVDRFKLINDRYGHDAGDTVLKQIALRTRAMLKSSDLVARLGGDEFVILVEGADDEDALVHKVDMLRAAILRPIVHGKTRIDAAVSVGIALFHPRKTEISEVLREADIALYASKQDGRNRVTFFTTQMGAAAKSRDRVEIELKQAVERNEFVLYYQPRLDIKTGKIVGAEGLVRWQHSERGIVMPAGFIPICEETGLIEDLGLLVLEMGCRQAIAWQQSGRNLNVSLNVSPRQFADPGFIDTLTQLAGLPDFPFGRIELEITENVLIGDHEIIAERLKTITAMGYNLAIDDFGTGYSNLSYISRFPLTCLKIDRSFISQLPESGPIVQLILTLAQQVGATVVSEGVETREQMAWLAENKCAEAQGYLITPPLPVAQFEDFCAGEIVFEDHIPAV